MERVRRGDVPKLCGRVQRSHGRDDRCREDGGFLDTKLDHRRVCNRTFTGLIGSVGLLLRKRWAKPVLIVSLIALVVLEGWIVFFSGALEQFGLAVPVMVSVGAIMLAWLATYARTKGWLS
jgi:hypothetical protein